MRRLIINADDFGLTAGVNRAIVEAHQRGIVTSTTLMANSGAFEAATAIARDHPALISSDPREGTPPLPRVPASVLRSRPVTVTSRDALPSPARAALIALKQRQSP